MPQYNSYPMEGDDNKCPRCAGPIHTAFERDDGSICCGKCAKQQSSPEDKMVVVKGKPEKDGDALR